MNNMTHRSACMQQVDKEVDPLVHSAVPLLFWGETGSGAAFYARTIHEASREGRFLRIPCFSLEKETIKAQLFGTDDQRGWLEEADNGTILFRQIEGCSPAAQRILYHLLSIQSVDGRIEFSRMGRPEGLEVNVRFMYSFAGNFNPVIQESLLNREFVELLRRQAKIVRIPPLRERKEDIIAIAQDVFEEFNKKYNQYVSAIDLKAKKLLTHYYWPGNVNELKRVIEGIIAQYPQITVIAAEHLPEYIKNSKLNGRDFVFGLKDNERFMGKFRSRTLRVQSILHDHSLHRVHTGDLVEVKRIEDSSFTPPKFRHFEFQLRDGSHIMGYLLDTIIKVNTSFNPSRQINIQDLHSVKLS